MSPDKILAFIKAGKLQATNAASPGSKRPRYMISEAAVAEFIEAGVPRTKEQRPYKTRRPKQDDGTIEFFPP